jgi:hypothetical protein
LSPSSVFGTIIPGHVVEDAVTTTLQTRLDTYLREVAFQWDRDILPGPRSYNVRPEGEKWTEDQLPAVIVTSPGTAEDPTPAGDGYYEAKFTIGVVVFCAGQGEWSVRHNMEDYCAAVRAALLQNSGLGGICSSMQWIGENYTPGPNEGLRTFGAGICEFVCTIDGVVNRNTGPSVPDVPPGTSWEIVEETELITEKLEGVV